jgi:hypothetical protein
MDCRIKSGNDEKKVLVRLALHRFNFQTATWFLLMVRSIARKCDASRTIKQPSGIRPCFGQATGCLSLFLSPRNDPGERSAERRFDNSALARRGARLAIDAPASRRSTGGDLLPRDRSDEYRTGFLPMIRRLSPPSSDPLCQPGGPP